MRSIIRFSVDGETNSALRNKLAKILTDAGKSTERSTGMVEHFAVIIASRTRSKRVDVVASDLTQADEDHRGRGYQNHFITPLHFRWGGARSN